MTTRSERLTAFLAEGCRLPFAWGERDCCLWPADWILAERGLDPAAELRGAYRSPLACRRLLRLGGGLLAVTSAEMRAAGLAGTAAPVLGDVGIIETAAGPMGAVCTGSAWALKTVEGIVLVPATPIMAWGV